MTKLLGLAFIASTAFTLGCADDGNADFETAAAEIEGIYKVSTHTRNETSCTPGGTALQLDEQFAIAFTQDLLGTKILGFMSCASVDDCRQKLAAIRAQDVVISDFYFGTNQLDGDRFVGQGASSGSLENGTCVGGARLDTALELTSATKLRLQQRTVAADPYAPRDGICWTDGARDSAEGNSCIGLEELTAELVEAL